MAIMRTIQALVWALADSLFFTPILAAENALSVDAAWARSTAPQAKMGAIYLRIVNSGADERLVSASVDASIAAALSIHEMKQDDRGMMRMLELKEGLPLPTGATVELVPGGKHLMLEGLKSALQVGQEFQITLKFAHAGEKSVAVVVKARATDTHKNP